MTTRFCNVMTSLWKVAALISRGVFMMSRVVLMTSRVVLMTSRDHTQLKRSRCNLNFKRKISS